jgi:2-acylglycerol O-acyltransferase 2
VFLLRASGIEIHPATLAANFLIPIWREIILRLGVISVSAKSLDYVLNKGPGNAVLVVPGGAAEALDAHPGTHSLTLNRRSGFFRIALQHGACLVPIYSFGENDLYEQAPNEDGTFVRTCQNTMLKYLGFATPFFSGAGSSGAAIPMNPIPSRVPVITVVGDPIKCPVIENPTREDIDRMRLLYIEKLQEIFKQFADKYAPQRSTELEIVK